MKITSKHIAAFALVAAASTLAVKAGPPFTSIEGYGGAAFNPFAYTAGPNKFESADLPFSKPQFAGWYVNLGDVDVDWTSIGLGFTVAQRLELSYSHEIIAPNGKNLYKDNAGAKLNLVSENAGGHHYVPAVSVGVVGKTISDVGEGVDDSGVDFYGVATKLITELPKPVLVSAGVLSTEGRVTGVFGFDSDRDTVGFANIDVLPIASLALGLEFKQGATFDKFENDNYWDAHAAWFATKNLSVIAAYVNAGDEDSTSKVGLGDGFVLSGQYAF